MVRWRNGPNGYGAVTKTLHWTIAAAMAAQFAVGYLMDGDGSGRGRGRGRGRGGDSGRGRGRGRGGEFDVFGDNTALTVHVVLGVTILALVIVRIVWRWRTPLPPWSEVLTPGQRVLAHWTERLLYVSMVAVPTTGLVLVISGEDDLVGLHVAAHILFFVALAAHVGLIGYHSIVRRDGLIRRMLPGSPPMRPE